MQIIYRGYNACLNNTQNATHFGSIINANVGMYLRISTEDGDKAESYSIGNQRRIIEEYLKQNNFVNVTEYVDDGYSGTNFNRPGFKNLLSDIEKKKINVVITKDLSRLGRDYIKTGYYIEEYFVEKQIRYIGILDNIDTYSDLIENELIPFRAILNDMYSKDISLKQKSSLKERKQKGRYIACFAPYGYKKDLDNRGGLIIDDDAGNIVKRIFEMTLNGLGSNTIANTLTSENISTPAIHMNMPNVTNSIKYDVWKGNTIKKILRNKTYLGYMIQNKETTLSHKNPQRIMLSEDEYIIIENHHKPLISEQDYNRVQKILNDRKKKTFNKRPEILLQGLIYCKECGLMLSRRYYKTNSGESILLFCNNYVVYKKCNHTASIKYKDIEIGIVNLLRGLLSRYSDSKKLKKLVLSNIDETNSILQEYKKDKEKLDLELNKMNDKIDLIYTDKLNNVITNEQYLIHTSKVKEQRKGITNKLEELKAIIEKEEQKINTLKQDESRMNKIINEFINCNNINNEIIKEFISKIEVDKFKNINVIFKMNLPDSSKNILLQKDNSCH